MQFTELYEVRGDGMRMEVDARGPLYLNMGRCKMSKIENPR
jgi:hypothetical protein